MAACPAPSASPLQHPPPPRRCGFPPAAALLRPARRRQGKAPGISIRPQRRGQSGGVGEGVRAKAARAFPCSLPPSCRISAALVSCILDAPTAARQAHVAAGARVGVEGVRARAGALMSGRRSRSRLCWKPGALPAHLEGEHAACQKEPAFFGGGAPFCNTRKEVGVGATPSSPVLVGCAGGRSCPCPNSPLSQQGRIFAATVATFSLLVLLLGLRTFWAGWLFCWPDAQAARSASLSAQSCFQASVESAGAELVAGSWQSHLRSHSWSLF